MATGEPRHNEDHADAEWVEIPDGGGAGAAPLQAIEVGGEELVLVRAGERYVAMDRWCPHQEGDLAQGRVLGGTLKCPLHGYMFSLDTGRGLNCRGFNTRVHEAQVADGMVQIRLRT
jgi:nitrite reductase/ring-hydroxylating ferredoxin subunit